MSTLKQFGWTGLQQEYYIKNINNDLSIGRVVSIKGFKYLIVCDRGEMETELSGKLLYGSNTEAFPK